jgi:hypothetical protein
MKTIAAKIGYEAHVERVGKDVQAIERRLANQPKTGGDRICVCPANQKPSLPHLFFLEEPDVFSIIRFQQQGWEFYWVSEDLSSPL